MKDLMFGLFMLVVGSDAFANVEAFDWTTGSYISVNVDGAIAGDSVDYYDYDVGAYLSGIVEYAEDNILVLCDEVSGDCRELSVEEWD